MKPARLNISEPEFADDKPAWRVARAYPLPARLYALIRFQIIPGWMLEAIEQHLPQSGRVADVGCGFGLFTIRLALRRPQCHFTGLELSAKRVAQARQAAAALKVHNVEFICADLAAGDWREHFDAAYCIDLLHHLEPAAADHLLESLYAGLAEGGALIVKDISTQPRPHLWFTFLLDLLMNPRDSFYYRHAQVWRDRMAACGFAALHYFPLRTLLPYPHFLLTGRKLKNES